MAIYQASEKNPRKIQHLTRVFSGHRHRHHGFAANSMLGSPGSKPIFTEYIGVLNRTNYPLAKFRYFRNTNFTK